MGLTAVMSITFAGTMLLPLFAAWVDPIWYRLGTGYGSVL